MVADLDDIGGTETVRRIEDLGGSAAFVKVDVSFPHDVRTMFAAAESTFGGLDIVHNNAGLISGEPIWPESELERILKVITATPAASPWGRSRGSRRCASVVVVASSTPRPRRRWPMPTDPVQRDEGRRRPHHGVLRRAGRGGHPVNAVLPGVVDTDMTNLHTGDGTRPRCRLQPILAGLTMLAPDDIAAAVIDLVRDDNAVAEARIVTNS